MPANLTKGFESIDGRENIVEGYYTLHAWREQFYALDVPHIDDPGYNRDRGPAWVGSVRAHIDL